MRWLVGLLGGAALLWLGSARASGPLPPREGDRIETSDYSVDLFQGPVLATTRITGMAGAYTAVAEGSDGIPFNPAAASLRLPWSRKKTDWDWSAGATLPASISGSDFDNNGDQGFQHQRRFFFGTLGGYVQHGPLAFGATVSLQTYGLNQDPLFGITTQTARTDVDVRFWRVDPVVSYAFLDGQLHIGGGIRAVYLQLVGDLTQQVSQTSETTVTTNQYANYAIGFQGGALWAPYALPLRLGGVFRSALTAETGRLGGGVQADLVGDIRAGDIYYPKRADLPWELDLGVAVQLWKRPLNVRFEDEARVRAADAERWRRTDAKGRLEPSRVGASRMLLARSRAIPRDKVLLTGGVLVSGPVENAVGIESMLSGKLQRSGEATTVTVRAGVESEVIPYWLVLRAGSYLEPSRFRASSPRLHGTAGFRVRAFSWDVFGLLDEGTLWHVSAAVDVARDYLVWSVGAGLFL